MLEILPLILVFPLAGMLLNAVFSRWMDETWIAIFACGASGTAFVIAILQAIALSGNHFHVETVLIADWITIGNLLSLIHI